MPSRMGGAAPHLSSLRISPVSLEEGMRRKVGEFASMLTLVGKKSRRYSMDTWRRAVPATLTWLTSSTVHSIR